MSIISSDTNLANFSLSTPSPCISYEMKFFKSKKKELQTIQKILVDITVMVFHAIITQNSLFHYFSIWLFFVAGEIFYRPEVTCNVQPRLITLNE